MPHGGPDWGTLGPLKTIYTLEDMAELAARLGSIVTFDRRGNVLFVEDFEGSLARCSTGASAGGSVVISNKFARYGDFSCCMTTGPDNYDQAYIGILLAYPVLSRMGIEVAWNRSDADKLYQFMIEFELYDGSNYWMADVAWSNDTKKWIYRRQNADFVDLSPTVDYYQSDMPFIHAKLVVDWLNKEYVRLIVNDQVYDMAGLGLYSVPNDTPGYLIVVIRTNNAESGAAVNYIDGIIITQNEP